MVFHCPVLLYRPWSFGSAVANGTEGPLTLVAQKVHGSPAAKGLVFSQSCQRFHVVRRLQVVNQGALENDRQKHTARTRSARVFVT
jgi:hypothetical protein